MSNYWEEEFKRQKDAEAIADAIYRLRDREAAEAMDERMAAVRYRAEADAAEAERARRAALTPEQRVLEDAERARAVAVAEAERERQRRKALEQELKEQRGDDATCAAFWISLPAIAIGFYLSAEAWRHIPDLSFGQAALVWGGVALAIIILRLMLGLALRRWVANLVMLPVLALGSLVFIQVVKEIGSPSGPPPPIPRAVRLSCVDSFSCETMEFAVQERIPLRVEGLDSDSFKQLCRHGYSDQRIDTQDPGDVYEAEGDCRRYDGSATGGLDLSDNWVCPFPGPWRTTWQLLDPNDKVVLSANIGGTCNGE